MNQGASIGPTNAVRYAISFGILFCIVSFYLAQKNSELWAHPTADATLTFFPANTAFIIAALTGVMIIWQIIQASNPQSLTSAGKMSLTIYVIHFIPLTLMQDYETTYQWGLTTSSLVVLVYTLIWIPLSTQWLKRYPKATLEATFKGIRKSL
jgi:fucose 4-O-acetylase-like acetyltransferase